MMRKSYNLVFHYFFHLKYSNSKKKTLLNYVCSRTHFNRINSSMVNTSKKNGIRQSLTHNRTFLSLAFNEPMIQFSWTTILSLFFGVPLGVYLYKVSCNIYSFVRHNKSKRLSFFF